MPISQKVKTLLKIAGTDFYYSSFWQTKVITEII